MAEQQQWRNGSSSLWVVLLRSRLLVLLFSMFVYSLGFATLVPMLPTLLTNYFASRIAGHAIDCEQYVVNEQPAACQDAHADVVTWTSWTSLVANTFIAFLFSPVIGDLSDAYGRKPFILAGLLLSALPIAAVFMYLSGRASLLWYYPCSALTSVVNSIVVFLSYTADVLQPQHRTAGFGLIIAAYSTGFMIGPQVAQLLLLDATTATLVAGGGCIAAFTVVLLAVPESRPPGSAAAVLPGCPPAASSWKLRPLDALLSLQRSWQLITSSSLFVRLALCMAIVGVVSEGIQDMLIQYLQLVVGFNTADQSLLFTLLGAANLVVQAALLPSMAYFLGERRLLITGLLFSIIEQAMLALVTTKWQALAAVSLGSLAGVSFPAISSIKSTHSRPDQQGLVQGALAGIRALATGLGPLAFALLFSSCTKTSAVFGYHPGIIFWTTCGLTVLAAAVAASIPAHLAAVVFDEAPGAELGLEALLGGSANFNFGNPLAQFWADLQGGASNPRVRRTQEMALQLRQQLAAMQLREYHDVQVRRGLMR
ncbi:hypothetical protein OEZ85_011715 [Tetradesmus obliquus]|uniref:Major facilitator superfamily (MFS) profile domain-containing protein n=1 Tax=Tetradesmus obliquus TaxID=3088 RepID=A0ABY8TV38_TETOB|nr:hypothetical protein OEZ85_011715 [Tetradesmus obliquus]